MIDGFMSRFSIADDVLTDPEYSPTNAVNGYVDVGSPDSQKLAAIFPSWHLHTDSRIYKRFMNRVANKGYFVRAYDLNDHILEPNIDGVIESHREIQQRVSADINLLNEGGRFKEIHLIGASLGTVSMALVAASLPEMTRATIIAGSSNLGLSMWDGIRTVNIKSELEASGITREELNEAWTDIAPWKQADAFSGRSVSMLISTTDHIIPTIYQEEMVGYLRNADANVSVKRTNLGHYAAIANTYARAKIIA